METGFSTSVQLPTKKWKGKWSFILRGWCSYSGLGRGSLNFWRMFKIPALISRKKISLSYLWEDGVSNFHLSKLQKLFFSFIFFYEDFFFMKSLIFMLCSRSPWILDLSPEKNLHQYSHAFSPTVISNGSVNFPVDVNLIIGHSTWMISLLPDKDSAVQPHLPFPFLSFCHIIILVS